MADVRIPASFAGDPFAFAGEEEREERYCMFCMGVGIHTIGYEDDDGQYREAVYECRRCAEEGK